MLQVPATYELLYIHVDHGDVGGGGGGCEGREGEWKGGLSNLRFK